MSRLPTRLEREFHDEMRNIYFRARDECAYRAMRFFNMVNELGGPDVARALLRDPQAYSEGFTKLWELGRLDISMEALVLQEPWRALFTEEELATARRRLKQHGYQGAELKEGR